MTPQRPIPVRALFTHGCVALALVALSVAPLPLGADDPDPFPQRIERAIGDRTVKLVRTGKAVRKQLGFKVYDVASYLQDGARARTAEELSAAPHAKQLHLIFVMTVPGDDMAITFESTMRKNYPAPAFAKELQQLLDQVRKNSARKGDRMLITHIPDKGMHYRFQSKSDVQELLIPNPAFSRAVWDNYFGEYNCGENVKIGLTAELVR